MQRSLLLSPWIPSKSASTNSNCCLAVKFIGFSLAQVFNLVISPVRGRMSLIEYVDVEVEVEVG